MTGRDLIFTWKYDCGLCDSFACYKSEVHVDGESSPPFKYL